MALLLAPMEGLLDFTLRDALTRVGGLDRCVSEFIRVTDAVLPERAYVRVIPELRQGSRTSAGVPVRAQLLGSDPICLADNAAFLATLGPAGIDLNFGCPAKVVNRHGGGAALLQEPELVHRIVREVRRAVPTDMPVSAKMRLGFHDDAQAEDCARAIAEGGADELVVHASTKADSGLSHTNHQHRARQISWNLCGQSNKALLHHRRAYRDVAAKHLGNEEESALGIAALGKAEQFTGEHVGFADIHGKAPS